MYIHVVVSMAAGILGVPGATQPGEGARSEETAHDIPVPVHPVWAAAGRAAEHRRDRPPQPPPLHAHPLRPPRPEYADPTPPPN